MKQPEILTPPTDLVPTGSPSGDFDTVIRQKTAEPADPTDWQTAMKRAIRSRQELLQRLQIPLDRFSETRISDTNAVESQSTFPTFVPLEFLQRMTVGDPHDPLLRQVLTSAAEFESVDGFGPNPVGDLEAVSAPGLLHKYDGRALMIATGACGVHCRYCFRREFPYASTQTQNERWRAAAQYVQEHHEIDEVLLSGGDPLTLTDERLIELLESIESIEHVRRLRIHSRMPVVIPQRVTDHLVDRLAQSPLTTWFVIHMNHPNEWDDGVHTAIAKLIDAGIPVLNQAVLLRGVNDDVDTLEKLCKTLVNHRVQPYYLHQLDRVHGAAHFEVPQSDGVVLIEQLRQRLPGYAMPTFVRELAGEPSKTPVATPPVADRPVH
ncbi:MAG: EF-P beta-lysylation protein EpmB [Pirellulaceae bacterium]|nr:EF-P beta-lysylation protein EpmB [Pirellulaceae bacterium]